MKANYSRLMIKIAGILGVTSVSFLVALPSQAQETFNYQSLGEVSSSTAKGSIKPTKLIAQGGEKPVLNPKPSIFNEPPYNRRSPSETTEPVTQPTEVPTRRTIEPVTQPSEVPAKPTTSPTASQNVVELAISNGSFTTLVAALKAAGLVDVLQGSGPFTIFAPTDAAFKKLPQDAVQELLKPENKEVLVKVLTYHVVPGKVLSTALTSGQVTSLQGDPITLKVDGKSVMVNDANVTQADILGSNGVIHQIDNLILPPSL
ncbi:fasciclin domain-containing protein [Cronbergia sp. UHCC 0137]|uniref:fasciclin domain-containing protein n=1 Tax=Cronbergia sp. UHCC 0137 TaxID=3110239 RepID=UPI002B21FF83|nr:fasciclin domain-containing protein [Cronbergia sp. UHCC 0137]MEA5620612.1 fasciclin domain-containing protein [Cronbergia sp. UHCC 0137]